MTVSEITSGVEVKVQAKYEPSHSQPDKHLFVFSYHITIANQNPYTVQLLSRKWFITNGLGEIEVVEGDGVVGRQPVLYPDDVHTYNSGAAIETMFGQMHGIYYFENKSTQAIFEVRIPMFKLETIEMLN